LGPALAIHDQYFVEFVTPTPSELQWQGISITSLTQLLTRYSQLTTLSLEGVVLGQAGLDVLLAQPHIVNVALLAIAATESRVDSPCSWRTLRLASHVDVRTVAYVPLHSIQKPLHGNALLLPPDVPPDQLPQLLLKATTRIAQHRHLSNNLSCSLFLYEYVTSLAALHSVQWRGDVQPAFSPIEQSALVAALEPLAAITEVTELVISFLYHPSPAGPPSRVRLGKPELGSLNRTWGSRITSLWMSGISLAPGFFPALETCFPRLKWLELKGISRRGRAWLPGSCCSASVWHAP
jgi:hypothetical protein